MFYWYKKQGVGLFGRSTSHPRQTWSLTHHTHTHTRTRTHTRTHTHANTKTPSFHCPSAEGIWSMTNGFIKPHIHTVDTFLSSSHHCANGVSPKRLFFIYFFFFLQQMCLCPSRASYDPNTESHVTHTHERCLISTVVHLLYNYEDSFYCLCFFLHSHHTLSFQSDYSGTT